MDTGVVTISVKGQLTTAPATLIHGRQIITAGRLLRTASIFDEDWDADPLTDPASVVAHLGAQPGTADLFTFAQKLPATEPRFDYPLTWDNVAAIPITSYDDWWNKLPQATRRNVRRAKKMGVVVKVVPFDETLVKGIKGIYDESPARQGKRFWHYGKPLEAVARENSSYVDRADFIGAFLNDELIGFAKMVHVGQVGSIMQILSRNEHVDKRPTNALIAKAVEVCSAKGLTHFVYCQYVYGKNFDSPLTEFKRRSGFEQILLPRYYVPLTLKGSIAVRCGLHLGLRRFLPKPVETALLKARTRFYEKSAPRGSQDEPDSVPGEISKTP